MTARLPVPGGDLGTWGTIYNTFLSVAHNADGTLIGSAPVLNVMNDAYGAKGDGTTDDTTAIQAAITACPAGGVVYFPPGTYKITSGLTTSTSNISLVGSGAPGQSLSLGGPSCVILVSGAFDGFTFNSAASSTIFRGPKIVGVSFRDTSSGTALGGIRINRANNWLIEDVVCADFTAGHGIISDGTGNVSQYGTITNCGMNNCLIGLDLVLSNGIRVFGGLIDGNNNSTTPTASSTGIRLQSNDTLKVFGTVIHGCATGVDLQPTGTAMNGLFGVRFEDFTTALSIAGDYNSIIGCNFNNTQNGSGGTGISLASTADRCSLIGNEFAAVGTPVSDSSTNITRIDHVQVNLSGTAATGFFGHAAVSRPSSVGTATGYGAGSTTATFHSDDTYTGNTGTTAYTINGIVSALKTLGLIAS